MDSIEDKERRSKWRESSAAGVFIATLVLMLIGAGAVVIINGWPARCFVEAELLRAYGEPIQDFIT